MERRRRVRTPPPPPPPTGLRFWFPKSVGLLFLASYCAGFAAELFMIRTGFYQIATRKAAERRLERAKALAAAFEKAPTGVQVHLIEMEERLRRERERTAGAST